MLFFDLPVGTPAQRRSYSQFRKQIIKDGFLMVQQSVYSKLVVNDAVAGSTIARLNTYRPAEGLVQVLRVTEKQYATMVYIIGTKTGHGEMDTMDEFVVL
jgi:CRISPR-associated protein Cas2